MDKEKNEGIKRELKDMSHIGLKLNNPDDFLDYSFSYYLPEAQVRIEKAAERFLKEVAVILDDDRAMSNELELHKAFPEGSRV